jgi:hypothetical protein
MPAASGWSSASASGTASRLRSPSSAEGVDLAFWFTFAGYKFVPGPGSRRDLDLASYGVVRMVPGGPGSGYQGLGWEPKLAFGALPQAG